MAVAYDGHASYSVSQAKSVGDPNADPRDTNLRVAPADHAAFDSTDPVWDDQPGAAARASGWPRAVGS